MIDAKAKFEMEVILSDFLQDYGYIDRITVVSYKLKLKDKSKHLSGIFNYDIHSYAYEVRFLENGDVEKILWLKLGE